MVADRRELAATFDLRWRELSLDETVAASSATLRPHAGPPSRAPVLPRISLDYAVHEGAAALGSAGHGDLQIVSTLGEGAMGRVHLARQRSLGRDVAVKTLKPGAPDQARTALLVEAAVTGALEHPGIVPVHALGVDDPGSPVLVMKRIEGVAWSELVYDDDHPAWQDMPLPGDRLDAHLEILAEVCNAVEFAHSKGIVHCDIKPENVMVGRFGEVYLVDFGIAVRRGTERGALAGSPGYMAPELVAGSAVDERTDVYLLGATLHEVLTRRMRHAGETMHQVLLAAFVSEPQAYDATVPAELAGLCNAATQHDPGARPARAMDVRRALVDFRTHKSSIALAATASARLHELEALLEAETFDVRRAYRLATECRFGYTQAIAEWAGNAAASAGLERCLEAMIEIEIRQGNASGARALLEELAEPRPALEARVRELERAADAQRDRDERLQRIEHDLDAKVGARSRIWVLLALGATGGGIAIFVMHRGTSTLRIQDLIGFALVVAVVSGLAMVVFRKQLFDTAFNRRIVGASSAVILGLLGSRLVSFATGATVAHAVTQDLVMMCVGATVAAFTVTRALGWAAGAFAAGLVLVVVFPAHAPEVFSTITLLAIAVTAIAWRT